MQAETNGRRRTFQVLIKNGVRRLLETADKSSPVRAPPFLASLFFPRFPLSSRVDFQLHSDCNLAPGREFISRGEIVSLAHRESNA